MKITTFQGESVPELVQKLFPAADAKTRPALEAALRAANPHLQNIYTLPKATPLVVPDDPSEVAAFARLDPRTAAFERDAAHEIAHGRKRAEQAFRVAEEELTVTEDLLKSPDFRAAVREHEDLRKTLDTVTREAGERRKELLAQKRALGLVSNAPRAKARARVQPKSPK